MDFVNQIVPTTNKSLTATKPTAMLQAKVSPLLRLAIGRWAQLFSTTHIH